MSEHGSCTPRHGSNDSGLCGSDPEAVSPVLQYIVSNVSSPEYRLPADDSMSWLQLTPIRGMFCNAAMALAVPQSQ